MAKKLLKVFSKNIAFNGVRNLGHHSQKFYEGVSEMPEKDAKIYCESHGGGYFCPELYEHHQVIVNELRGGFDFAQPDNEPDSESEKGKVETGDDGKVEVRFLEDEGIHKVGGTARFKPDTAAKKVNAGIVEYTEVQEPEPDSESEVE